MTEAISGEYLLFETRLIFTTVMALVSWTSISSLQGPVVIHSLMAAHHQRGITLVIYYSDGIKVGCSCIKLYLQHLMTQMQDISSDCHAV